MCQVRLSSTGGPKGGSDWVPPLRLLADLAFATALLRCRFRRSRLVFSISLSQNATNEAEKTTYIQPLIMDGIQSDCGKDDPDLNKEMEKQFVDLVTEELKLQEAVAAEHAHHMNLTLADARRLASQYREEAEKCNAATETCEEARERAQASLTKEKKITLMWERRARQLGWAGE
ncbi:hypothetical protein QJS10_CPB19g00675 [Acorus calamus]|uniref:Uncharacterized protein n=1 Tax=Acorus calamus TaxID=4465 RepID=A0AAV9CID9_ACOCL|nr:hypothetical protein QJS10_CPB19g00675 [Acorus calamus]